MIEIIHELRMARGTKAKLEILKKHKENEAWKAFLYCTYNESINYYTGVPKETTFVDEVNAAQMMEDASKLASREFTGNKARDFAYNCSSVHGVLFRLMLGRSIKAGISYTTINKAYPGLIPVFEYMKGKDVPINRYPLLCGTKYDGIRLITTVTGSKVICRTSSGKELEANDLMDRMSVMPDGVYDGELICGTGRMKDRPIITGLVNKILLGKAEELGNNFSYMTFDYMGVDDWRTKDCGHGYLDRLMMLHEALKPDPYIQMAKVDWVYNQSDVDSRFSTHIDSGFEGLILRYPDDIYEWRRSPKLNKKKAIKEAILTCSGIICGEGKYEGMIVSLDCYGTVEGKEVEVFAGSGLSDHDREQDNDYFEGKQIEVLYNDVVIAKGTNKTHSLFLPRFKRVLGDKL